MDTTPRLFEASWEVCNKVGGIYTVIASKVRYAEAAFPDNYWTIGPYISPESHPEFQEEEIPAPFHEAAAHAGKQGVGIHYGTWRIPGRPKAFLLSWEGLLPNLDGYKSRFWEAYKLDTLGSNFYDVDQPLIWSIAIGIFVQAIVASSENPVVLQAHEWMTGASILYLNLDPSTAAKVRTVFTTHATVLGRAISNEGRALWNCLPSLNPDEEARRLGVVAKHQIEALSARTASSFTTVSHVTAEEAEKLLGRAASVITENGLNIEDFPAFDNLTVRRANMRSRLSDFAAAYFFPYYQFDLSRSHFQFTMGRYEVHNKGYDTYLEALGHLNQQLKDENSEQTVLSFFLIPGDTLRPRADVLTQLNIYQQTQRLLNQHLVELRYQWYRDIMQNVSTNIPVPESCIALQPARQTDLDHILSRLPRTHQEPPLSAFELRSGDNDALVRIARENGLLNRKEDRVKIVIMPVYLDGFDGILNLPLYDIVTGFDLGVFPSFYEPWGYTPMESLALGVPAITSNLAGFGRAVENRMEQLSMEGVFLLNRQQDDKEVIANLLTFLRTNLEESSRCWIKRRVAAHQIAEEFSWDRLYLNYREAYRQAED